MKKLRKHALKRQKSPTEKINSVLRRKALFAKRNPKEAEKYSHELIFAQASDNIQSTRGVKKRKLKLKYGGTKEANITSVGLNEKFISTRRLIHTHPLIIIKKKLIQIPTPSISDLIVLLNNNAKSSLIAVPSKKNTSKIAGYLVIKKTQKSAPLLERIKRNQQRFFNNALENSENINYWTTLIKNLGEEKNKWLMSNPRLNTTIKGIISKSEEIQKINQSTELTQKRFDEKIAELRQRYYYQQIDQITFEKETAKLREEKERERIGSTRTRIQAKSEIIRLLNENKAEINLIQTHNFLLENGFINKFSEINPNKPSLYYAGFQKLKAGSSTNIKQFPNEAKKKELVEKELGLQLRLVPTKGFKVINGQFVKS